ASQKRCEPIQIPLCADSRYKYTFFPNPIIQADLQSLKTQADHFKPLLRMACHPHLKFFVCSVFAPMCPEQMPRAVTSCRSLCEDVSYIITGLQVRRECSGVLNVYSVDWPESLNCSKFPESPELCMSPASNDVGDGDFSSYSDGNGAELSLNREYGDKGVFCSSSYVDLDVGDRRGICAFKCNSKTMFSNQEKQSTQMLMLLGGTITLSVTAFTVLTFLIDRQRFLFPER
uniref:FZ domain-containing protein n=1 Tax=Syphacia muris TaxID=451379 RepID=A0A0N5AY90_9BILA